jgi:D-alanyl-D-alanine carboxypeptidase
MGLRRVTRLTAGLIAAFILYAGPGTAHAARSAQPKFAALVLDADSGRVLYERDADAQKYPASLTKMMTLYMVFDAVDRGRIKLHQRLPVSAHAAQQAPSKLGLEKGETITVEQAIKALVVKSANDVAVVVAEAIGGSEENFALMMSAEARRLGMRSTAFRNASGLPDKGQVSTARDMATLARTLQRRFVHHYHYFSTASFTWGGVVHTNHNRLLEDYEGADGIKTGYIRASGFNLVASARREGRRVIGVVFGGTSPAARNAEMARLLDHGFGRLGVGGGYDRTLEATGRRAPAIEVEAQGDGDGQRVGATGLAAGRVFGIQVGAFQSHAQARDAALAAKRTVDPVLSDGQVVVAPTKPGKQRKEIFRARILGLDKGQVQEACRLLKRKRMECIEVKTDETEVAFARQ